MATCEEAANVKECRVESMSSLRVYKVRLRVKGLGMHNSYILMRPRHKECNRFQVLYMHGSSQTITPSTNLDFANAYRKEGSRPRSTGHMENYYWHLGI